MGSRKSVSSPDGSQFTTRPEVDEEVLQHLGGINYAWQAAGDALQPPRAH